MSNEIVLRDWKTKSGRKVDIILYMNDSRDNIESAGILFKNQSEEEAREFYKKLSGRYVNQFNGLWKETDRNYIFRDKSKFYALSKNIYLDDGIYCVSLIIAWRK